MPPTTPKPFRAKHGYEYKINKAQRLPGKPIWISVWLLLLFPRIWAQDIPLDAPYGAYTEYFRYFDPGDASMPAGSSYVSRGVAFLANIGPQWQNWEEWAGSAFIIQTFRDDDTICMCTAGHIASKVFNWGTPYAAAPYVVHPFTVYLNYIGRPNNSDTTLNKTISSYASFIPVAARLVAYHENPVVATDPDIALFLIDKRQLPAVARFAQIGYRLNSYYGQPSNGIGQFYQIGHPNSMPQRTTTGAAFSPGSMQNPYRLTASLSIPNGAGPGSSGSPWLIKILPNGILSNTGTAVAVHSTSQRDTTQPIPADALRGQIHFARQAGATELAFIAAAIKQHCWKNKTEALLEQTKEYMNTVIVDNMANIQPYNISRTLSQSSDLTSISSPSSYTTATSNSGSFVSVTYIRANVCSLAGFTLPTNNGITNYPWQINIMARETVITPGESAAFEYTPTENAALTIGAALVEDDVETFAANSLIPSDERVNPEVRTSTQRSLGVWPNPSATGHFSIAIPGNKEQGNYHAVITDAATGRKVAEGTVLPANTYPINLSAYAKGIYVATFYQNGKQVYATKLIYE